MNQKINLDKKCTQRDTSKSTLEGEKQSGTGSQFPQNLLDIQDSFPYPLSDFLAGNPENVNNAILSHT